MNVTIEHHHIVHGEPEGYPQYVYVAGCAEYSRWVGGGRMSAFFATPGLVTPVVCTFMQRTCTELSLIDPQRQWPRSNRKFFCKNQAMSGESVGK